MYYSYIKLVYVFLVGLCINSFIMINMLVLLAILYYSFGNYTCRRTGAFVYISIYKILNLKQIVCKNRQNSVQFNWSYIQVWQIHFQNFKVLGEVLKVHFLRTRFWLFWTSCKFTTLPEHCSLIATRIPFILWSYTFRFCGYQSPPSFMIHVTVQPNKYVQVFYKNGSVSLFTLAFNTKLSEHNRHCSIGQCTTIPVTSFARSLNCLNKFAQLHRPMRGVWTHKHVLLARVFRGCIQIECVFISY